MIPVPIAPAPTNAVSVISESVSVIMPGSVPSVTGQKSSVGVAPKACKGIESSRQLGQHRWVVDRQWHEPRRPVPPGPIKRGPSHAHRGDATSPLTRTVILVPTIPLLCQL